MADNITAKANVGAGVEILAADDIGGVLYPRSKIVLGADGVNDGDVSSANPLPITTAAIANHNAPFSDGSPGIIVLGKRRDSDSTLVADGDLNTFNMDEEGRLKVSSKPASYPDITGDITAIQATIGAPVAGGTVSGDVSRASNVMALCSGTFSTVNCTFEGSLEASGDTNWFGIQAVRTNANTIETTTGNLSAQPAYGWEMSVNALKRVRVRATARTSGTQSWRFVQGTYATEPIPAAQVSATQPVSGTVTATLSAPAVPTASIVNSAATTNGTIVKGSAGTLYSITACNNTASAKFLKLHNSTTVTVGTTAVAMTIQIPANTTLTIPFGSQGMRYGTGICLSITGAVGDTDTTAVAVGDVKVNTAFI